MFEKTLPIGSVVLLEGAKKRLLIVGYHKCIQGKPEKGYDYIGCPYPEGFLAPDKMALFDHSQIRHIFALGFQNLDQFAFREKLEQALQKEEDRQ